MNYKISRLSIVFIWLYHGLVPKIIFRSSQELELINRGLDNPENPYIFLYLSGVGEIVAGLIVLLLWEKKWPIQATIVAMTILLIGAFVTWPQSTVEAFNPVTLNVAVIALCFVNLNSSPLTSMVAEE